MHTSEVAFEPSLHGTQRRAQRDIAKRDLQAAVKYGIKERAGCNPQTKEPRWKYTFADIVYITDETSTVEVTSWALELPMERKVISKRNLEQVQEARRRITENPGIITSHHVCLVDMSASMRKSDMNGHSSRFRAAYYSLAEEYIAKLIRSNSTFSGTDVVTLIEMRDDATVVFELEPISWVLYNRFVDLALGGKQSSARSHGNFQPSLFKAFELLKKYDHDKCAPSLFFLSDGSPSDRCTSYHRVKNNQAVFLQDLASCIDQYCRRFGERLTLTACGYGHIQFDVMESIVATAKACKANAMFSQTSIDPNAIKNTLSSIISSTMAMRSQLTGLNFTTDHTRVLSKAQREPVSAVDGAKCFIALDWRMFVNRPGEGVLNEGSTHEDHHGQQNCERYTIEWFKSMKGIVAKYKKIRFLSDSGAGIMVKRNYFGIGAERTVFEMMEIDAYGSPVGIPLVAKESCYELEKGERFHLKFMKTQMAAGKLAQKFNKRLEFLNVDKTIPRVHFLECFIYGCDQLQTEFLAEKRLDPKKYQKWNDNAGGVDGVPRAKHAFIPFPNAIATASVSEKKGSQYARRGRRR